MDKETVELLIRTGPDSPMGKLMRRYWVPVMLSSEIAEPDCPPVRVKILGEKLLAFRDSQGRPGLVDEFCAHRGVSLFLGRNEEGGIRCSYHGWKFDVTGQCMELPSVPALASKMHITAIRVWREATCYGPTWVRRGTSPRCPNSSGRCCRPATAS